jgi:pilus assembly protein TadC
MQMIFSNTELALEFAILSILFWFAPEGSLTELWRWLVDSDAPLQSALLAAVYAFVVGLVEPFFVAAGFAMYLNRRVELEAWDIEQEFRRAFTPAAVKDKP